MSDFFLVGVGGRDKLLSDSCMRLCAYFQGPLLVVDCTTSIGERAQETGKEKYELILA